MMMRCDIKLGDDMSFCYETEILLFSDLSVQLEQHVRWRHRMTLMYNTRTKNTKRHHTYMYASQVYVRAQFCGLVLVQYMTTHAHTYICTYKNYTFYF